MRIFDGEKLAFKVTGHPSRIKSLSFISNYVVSASSDGWIQVYDLIQNKVIGTHKTLDRLTCILAMDSSVEQVEPPVLQKQTADAGDSETESE